jgi:hypothetical protein
VGVEVANVVIGVSVAEGAAVGGTSVDVEVGGSVGRGDGVDVAVSWGVAVAVDLKVAVEVAVAGRGVGVTVGPVVGVDVGSVNPVAVGVGSANGVVEGSGVAPLSIGVSVGTLATVLRRTGPVEVGPGMSDVGTAVAEATSSRVPNVRSRNPEA